MKTHRCSFTLPESLYDDLTTVSRGLGLSRSGVLVHVLGDSLHMMATAITDFHASGSTPEAALRLRGESVHKATAIYQDFIETLEVPEGRPQ